MGDVCVCIMLLYNEIKFIEPGKEYNMHDVTHTVRCM